MFGEFVLDGFHVGVRFEHLLNIAKGLEPNEESPALEDIVRDIYRAKGHLWHGCVFRALQRLDALTWDVSDFSPSETQDALSTRLEECRQYIDKDGNIVIDYGDRYRHGEPITTSFVESAVNQVVSKRFVKKQQMSWSDANAERLLQVRTAVLNDALRRYIERWCPSIAANDDHVELAA